MNKKLKMLFFVIVLLFPIYLVVLNMGAYRKPDETKRNLGIRGTSGRPIDGLRIIRLGTLPPGAGLRKEVEFCNVSGRELTVDSIETSCPCVKADLLPVNLKPNQSAILSIIFDPKEEPEFRGSLSVSVIGRDRTGATAFESRVEIIVQSNE